MLSATLCLVAFSIGTSTAQRVEEQSNDETSSCYQCTSPLPYETDPNAKLALKALISRSYNLPEVHDHCAKPKDPNFETVFTGPCSQWKGFGCTKITVSREGLSLTVRGCTADIFKNATSAELVAGSATECGAGVSPSLCLCGDRPLCNDAASNRIDYGQILKLKLALVSLMAVSAAVFVLFCIER